MGRCTKRYCDKKSLKQNETSSEQLSRYKRMGTNKLRRIKDPESYLRKAVLINNSIQFCNEIKSSRLEAGTPSGETKILDDDNPVAVDDDHVTLFTPEMVHKIDNILNVFSSPFTDLECMKEIPKISPAEKSVVVNEGNNDINVTKSNDYSNNDIDNILSELELPPLLDPLESFEEFRNNFLESEAANSEGSDPVENFEDLVEDFTHFTDGDSDIPLDENNETFLLLNKSSSLYLNPVNKNCVT